MSRKKRYFRCPECAFEHPTISEPELREDRKVVSPWACPICKASGSLAEDGAVSRQIPDPELRKAQPPEHGISCPSYSWACMEDWAEAPLP
jgi:hypothetical protein